MNVCHFTYESVIAENDVQCCCVEGDRETQRDTWVELVCLNYS